MITVMRKYRKTLQVALLVVVAAFIVTSVVVFGSGMGGGERPDVVATVNGETIPVERFERRYKAYADAYARVYRDRFTPELAQQMGLPQQVVNDLVQETLVVQRARAEGLEVSDEELNAQMHAVPAFQDGGRFSMKRYEDFLKARNMSKTAFESDVRRELTRIKVENMVKSGIKVTDAEIEQAFRHRGEAVRAAWALVDTAPLAAAITPTDNELKKYLEEHTAEFRLPERRRVQYVTIGPRDVTATVSPADIEKYYAEHASEFETPRQVKGAHILARVPETGGSEAEDKARAKIADVIRRVKAGEDFGKLARELSEDPGTAPGGGDLGYVTKGEMTPQFEEALFALRKGEVSAQPVRTPFGFHAIKAADIKEAEKKPLQSVTAQIRERLAAEASDRAAKAKADELRPVLQAAKDFMAEAKGRGLTAVETTIPRSERRGLGGDPIEETAFGLSPAGVSAPVKTPAGYVVMKALDTLPSAVPPLQEIKDKVLAAVRRQKADGQAQERARQVAVEAKSGDFLAAAKKVGATTGETARFTRAKPAERLPGDAMLAALHTPVNGVSEPVRTPQGYYVVKVLERVPPDPATLVGERDKLSREVLGQKQSQAWESWVSAARTNAKVEVSPRLQRRG